MEPLPCLVTGLDRLEIPDLRHRLERLMARIVSGPGVSKSFGATTASIADSHGSITLNQNVATLTMKVGAWEGMGSLDLTMPMPAGGDRPATASRLKADDVVRLLATWLGFLDAPSTSGNTHAPAGASNFSRLAGLVSALVRSVNPAATPASRITIVPPFPWAEEGHVQAQARVSTIKADSKAILDKDLERRLLDLHPGAVIERNQGNRSFRMGHTPPIVFPIEDVGPIAIMRALADLQVQTIRKPVLKAGLALR